MLRKILINSIDVTSVVLNFEYEETWGEAISTISINAFGKINSLLTLAPGLTVQVYRGWVTATDELLFNGYIESYEPEPGKIKISCNDKAWDLVRKEFTHTYDSSIDASAGKISEIFKDIVTTYGGLTADSVSVQDSGTTQLITKFICNHVDPYERCQALADALSWQFYYRADTDKVYFEIKGNTTNPNTFTVGSNIIQVPVWNYDNTLMCNDLTVIGAYQEVETTKTGIIGTTNGFTTTGITLDFEPISVKVFNDTVSTTVPLVGGQVDSTAVYDYYVDKTQHSSTDFSKKTVLPKPSTTFVLGNTYEVRYSLAAPIPIHMWTQASIDTYGQFKKTITYTDIRNLADAEQRGKNFLAQYATPFLNTTIKVKVSSTNNLRVGQMIQVVDNKSIPNITRTLLVSRRRVRFPGDYEELEIGDKIWRIAEWQADVDEKFKRIAEDEFANQDISNELVEVDNTLASEISVVNRYLKLSTQTASGVNIFILGNHNFGILGTNKLGSTGIGAEVSYFVQQGNNIYTENFIDNDFKDAVNTTASGW